MSVLSLFLQGAIVGINVFYFILILKRGGVQGVPGSGGSTGYASFPEGQSGGDDKDDDDHRQYAPPEY